MAILAALIAFGSRFAVKILTTALGWASTLLFGRVPASRQKALLAITFGSVIWIVLVIGVVVPAAGTFLLLLVPPQDLVPEWIIRAAMLVGALVVPAVVGGMILWLSPDDERGARHVLGSIARGYPLTVVLAVLLVFLAVLAVYRKASSLARGWTDAHVPIVVQPGAYDQVAADLDRAISAAGLDVTAQAAPASMSKPATWLTAVAGRGSSALVPDRMVRLVGPDLDILIYPMDLLISGKPQLVMRARAAMASRLTTTAAHLTVSAEAQALEDRLEDLAGTPPGQTAFDADAAEALASIDRTLQTVEIPYEEWELLYRQRLQVERDLRRTAMTSTPDVTAAAVAAAAVIRDGADALLDAATDARTAAAVDRVAGQRWGFVASIIGAAVRGIRRPSDGSSS